MNTRKRRWALTLVICLVMTLFTPLSASAVSKAGFTDVQNKNDYFYTPVYWAVEKGITAGTTETTFSPKKPCTRAQIVTFLWRLSGQEKVKAESAFKDVKSSDYFADAVKWAVDRKITVGTAADQFSPGSACTRAQIVTFLWRMDGEKTAKAKVPFSDVKDSDYFSKAVSWAVENEITAGTSGKTFSPKDTCTRAQAMTFIYRYAQLESGSAATPTPAVKPTPTAAPKPTPTAAPKPTPTATPKPTPTISVTFTAKYDAIPCDQDIALAFFAEGTGNGKSISVLDKDGKLVATMNDEGKDGDETAGDGRYTGIGIVNIAAGKSAVYSLWIDDIKKGEVTVSGCEVPDPVAVDVDSFSFTSNPSAVRAGTINHVTFFVTGAAGTEFIVKTADNSEELKLADSGENGDDVANDGTYSATVALRLEENEDAVYTLWIDGKENASVTITSYSDEQFSRTQDSLRAISDTVDSEIEELRTVSSGEEKDKARQTAEANIETKLKEMAENGEIESWSKNGTGYTVDLPVGQCIVPMNRLVDGGDYWSTISSGSSNVSIRTATVLSADKTPAQIVTVEPFYKETYAGSHDKCAKQIDTLFAGFSFAKTLDNDHQESFCQIDGNEVTSFQAMEFYRYQLSRYNIIIWNGHGDYTDTVDSYLYTGLWRNNQIDHAYADDLASGKLLWIEAGADFMYGMPGDFFVHHYKDTGNRLNDSLVYLGCCCGARNGGVAQAMIKCGAKAAIGYNSYVYKDYEDAVVRALFAELCMPDYLIPVNVTLATTPVSVAYGVAFAINENLRYNHYKNEPADVVRTKPVLYRASGLTDYRLSDYAYHPVSDRAKYGTGRESITFGRYFQNAISDPELISQLYELEADERGMIELNDMQYSERDGRYFRKDPIEWIVLDESDGVYTLMSKYVLYIRDFGGENFWHESSIRTWLNEEFMNDAFTPAEQNNILTTTNVTMYWPYWDAYVDHKDKQYVTTEDKVYLLDMDEISNPAYGFDADTGPSVTREAYATQYADFNQNLTRWWIRGPAQWNYGNLQEKYIAADGSLAAWYGTYGYGVRPVIRVDKGAVIRHG